MKMEHLSSQTLSGPKGGLWTKRVALVDEESMSLMKDKDWLCQSIIIRDGISLVAEVLLAMRGDDEYYFLLPHVQCSNEEAEELVKLAIKADKRNVQVR